MTAPFGGAPTERQVSYILHLQGKLGLSTRYIDLKSILGKNPVQHRMNRAEASRIIQILEKRIATAAEQNPPGSFVTKR